MEVDHSPASTKRDPDIRKQVSRLAKVDVSISIIASMEQCLHINFYTVFLEKITQLLP